jgi:hypothetical protein
VVEKMAVFGARPAGGPPEQLYRVNADDYTRLIKTINDLKITAD